MRLLNFYRTCGRTVMLSKFPTKNIKKIVNWRSVRLSIAVNPRYKLLTQIWVLLIVAGQKPKFSFSFVKQKRGRLVKKLHGLEATLYAPINISYACDKIINLILPYKEDLIEHVATQKITNANFTFKNCATHSEFDLMIPDRGDLFLDRYDLTLSFNYNTANKKQIEALTRFYQFPVFIKN